jgi:NAD(P)-dependent dehydrogenase (short-subunit alcohol dehydrogenase family)
VNNAGASGVRVNAVRPGVVRTDFSAGITNNAVVEEMLAKEYVLKRFAEPEDVPQAGLFFSGPARSHLTGRLLGVDGGWGSVHARG